MLLLHFDPMLFNIKIYDYLEIYTGKKFFVLFICYSLVSFNLFYIYNQ